MDYSNRRIFQAGDLLGLLFGKGERTVIMYSNDWIDIIRPFKEDGYLTYDLENDSIICFLTDEGKAMISLARL